MDYEELCITLETPTVNQIFYGAIKALDEFFDFRPTLIEQKYDLQKSKSKYDRNDLKELLRRKQEQAHIAINFSTSHKSLNPL